MSSIVLDHPEVVWILRSGYPSWCQPEPIYCEECGRDITDDNHIYEDESHEHLCGQCLLELHEVQSW